MKLPPVSGIVLTLILAAFGVERAPADQFDILNSRFSGVSQSLHALAYGNGVYIAVGNNGTILYSSDTVTWIPQVSGTTNSLNGVKYGTNGFVAVGDASTILMSSNGANWVLCACPTTNKLSAITYGIGRYVAVGSAGTIVTSTNGINWSSINTGAPYNFNGVDFTWFNNEYPNYIFVLVGDSGTIMTSPDGLAWTSRFSGTFFKLNSVSLYSQTYNNYNMVTVGDSGTLLTSSDGITWTVRTSGTTSNLLAIANDYIGKGNAARFGTAGQGGVFLTGNGSSWTAQTSSTTTNLNGILYANGNFLATGDNGIIQAGILWLPRNSSTTQPLTSVAYANGKFIAVGGNNPTNVIISSTNGNTWSTVYGGLNGALNSIACGSNGWVTAGNNGAILFSSDGLSWSSHNVGTTNTLNYVTYGNGTYVILGAYTVYSGPSWYYQPVTFQSADGVNWNGPYSTGLSSSGTYKGIAFGTNVFVAFSSSGNFATSADGVTWTNRNFNVNGLYDALTFGNEMFVAPGEAYTATSPDGTNWTASSSAGVDKASITYGDEGFVVPCSFAGNLTTSSDGINWTERGFNGAIGGIAFGNNSYVIVGGQNISQSIQTNAQAMPLLTSRYSPQGFQLFVTAQPSYHYRVQFCTNLVIGNWSDLFAFTNLQAVTNFIDSSATNQLQGFYRIISP